MPAKLEVTPNSIPADTDTPLRFVGSGFQANAQLTLYQCGVLTYGDYVVSANGDFDITIGSLRLAAGTYHPCVVAQADNYNEQKRDILHVG